MKKALNDTLFVGLKNSDEIKFQIPEDPCRIGPLWNERFQFYRISE